MRLEEHWTLEHVTFSVERGERVVLLGANGSGKSTLARLANGLLLPVEGEVIAEGISSWRHDTLSELRRMVGLVAQDPDNQIVSTTVLDELAFGPQNLGWQPERIHTAVSTALDKVGLPREEFAKRDPNSLSGGEKQRVVIAAVIAMQPHYLVLDEPTALLDPAARAQILFSLDRLSQEGHGILHITHLLKEAESADRVIVFQKGRLVYNGAPDTILKDTDALLAYGLLAFPKRLYAVHSAPCGSQRGSNTESETGPGLPEPGKAQSDQPEQARAVSGQAEPGLFKKARAVSGQAEPGLFEKARAVSGQAEPGLFKKGRTEPSEADPGTTHAGTTTNTKGCISLKFSQVSFSYPNNPSGEPALDCVDLELSEGDCLLLVGASGSGKSTLLSLAAGLIQPAHGTVLLGKEPPVPGQVGLVFQQPETQLFAQTVEEDILFGPRNLGLPEDTTEEELVSSVLRAVGLMPESFRKRSPFSLSGGEARRVAIATILALNTTFLLLDEPTAGLDAKGRVFVFELLEKLLFEGKGVIIATHDPDFFSDLATKRREL